MLKKKIIFILLILSLISFVYAATEKEEIIKDFRTSKTECQGTNCKLTLGRHEVLYKNEWINIDNAKTLKGKSGFNVNIISDGVHIVNIKDFNSTTVTLNLTLNNTKIQDCKLSISKDCLIANEVNKEAIPIKIELSNGSKILWSNSDLKSKEVDSGTIKLKPNEVLHIGKNSTKVTLNTTDGTLLADTFFYSSDKWADLGGNNVGLYWWLDDSLFGSLLFTFDISNIPIGKEITDTELYFYMFENRLDVGTEGYTCHAHAFYDDWDELDLNYYDWIILNTNTTPYGNITYFGGIGEQIGWQKYNTTEIMRQEYAHNEANLSIVINCSDMYGGVANGDYLRVYLKEWVTDSQRPYLTITYEDAESGGGDTNPPGFNPSPTNNTIHYHNDSYYQDINANETIDTWKINDTIRFKIDSNGVLENNTKLGVGVYYVNVTINDTSNNYNYGYVSITINKGTPTATLSITPDANEVYPSTTTASGAYCSPEISCQLYLNGSQTDNTSINIFGVGHYLYDYRAKSNENFTIYSSNNTLIISINTTDNFNIVLNDTSGKVETIYLKVGTNIKTAYTILSNGTQISNNTIEYLFHGSYNYTVLRNDTQNYSNNRQQQIINVLKSYTPYPLNLVSNISIITGTPINTQRSYTWLHDHNYFNVTETVGAPGFNIRINFTNFTAFNTINIWEYYNGNIAHEIDLDLKVVGGGWRTVWNITDDITIHETNISISDYTIFNNSGHIDARIIHNSPGNIQHTLNIDRLSLNWSIPYISPCDYTGGNFNLNVTCSYSDTTINIDGNLTIYENGYLNLTNTILNFNSTYQFIRFYGVANMDKIRFNGTSGIN